MDGLPILFDLYEAERLHAVAYTAAIQTGAKGDTLDRVSSEIFWSLAAQANRAVLQAFMRPRLKIVDG